MEKKKARRILTDWDKTRSMTLWEVPEDAKEKGFSEMRLFSPVSPPVIDFSLSLTVLSPKIVKWARALEAWRAETLQERERNSIGSNGVSGGRTAGSDLHASDTGFSIRERKRECGVLTGRCKRKMWMAAILKSDRSKQLAISVEKQKISQIFFINKFTFY